MFPRLYDLPEGLDFLEITNYGILVALGFLLGLWVTLRLAGRMGIAREHVWDIAIWGLLCGLIGAKVVMVLLDLPRYLKDPGSIWEALRYAGVFYGGLLVALAFLVLYCRRKKIPVLKVTDLFVPGLALAHAFGRMGCFAVGCCYGSHCELPWAVTFTNEEAAALVGTPLNTPIHPVQLYEAGGNLLIFAGLYLLARRGVKPGTLTALYGAAYAAARFLWEFVRADPRGAYGPLSTSQWFALGVLLILVPVFFIARSRYARPQQAESGAGGPTDD